MWRSCCSCSCRCRSWFLLTARKKVSRVKCRRDVVLLLSLCLSFSFAHDNGSHWVIKFIKAFAISIAKSIHNSALKMFVQRKKSAEVDKGSQTGLRNVNGKEWEGLQGGGAIGMLHEVRQQSTYHFIDFQCSPRFGIWPGQSASNVLRLHRP